MTRKPCVIAPPVGCQCGQGYFTASYQNSRWREIGGQRLLGEQEPVFPGDQALVDSTVQVVSSEYMEAEITLTGFS